MDDKDFERLRKRVDELEKHNVEYQAMLNRGKGMIWLIVIIGAVATSVLTLVNSLRDYIAGPS